MTVSINRSGLSPLRAHFPALSHAHGERASIYFDNPGGTQVPAQVLEAMRSAMVEANANTGGAFRTSERSDTALTEARSKVADFLGASPDELIFGANMTTLTFAIGRGIGSRIASGDEIIITTLDHDANVTPWKILAEERGATIRNVDISVPDCRLDLDHFRSLLSPRTKLVAVGYASNATGTINDIATVVRLSHQVGAWVYVDAVQYAPHGPIDVKTLDCDFLVCSAYKFFGPHVGVLYGKAERLRELPAYKVRPQSDAVPYRHETGTLNHEGMVGTGAAIDYLASIGRQFGGAEGTRREALVAGMSAIRHYEMSLFERLIEGIEALPGVEVWGITDRAEFDWRGPTICFTWPALSPRETAAWLGHHDINAWDGDYFATSLMERLGLAPDGAVRLGLAHYNTAEEVDRVLEVLDAVATRSAPV